MNPMSTPPLACPNCQATDVRDRQGPGSEIVWFICQACAHVWFGNRSFTC